MPCVSRLKGLYIYLPFKAVIFVKKREPFKAMLRAAPIWKKDSIIGSVFAAKKKESPFQDSSSFFKFS